MTKRRLPSLNAIRAFEAAGRLESITDAALELSVTPTAISHQIRHLEQLLGIRLFQRTGRRITLTAQGARILPILTKGMDYLAEAFSDTYGEESAGQVNITTTREFARYWLLPRLEEFYVNYPEITLNIYSSETCDDLNGNEFDVAIRYGQKPDEATNEIELFQEYYVATFRRPDSQTPTIACISEMSPKRLIDVRWENSDLIAPHWKKWFEICNLDRYEEYSRMSFDAYNMAFDALKRGHGAALLSRTIVTSEECSPDLYELQGPRLPGYYYRLIMTPSGKRKATVQKFADWLLEKVRPLHQ